LGGCHQRRSRCRDSETGDETNYWMKLIFVHKSLFSISFSSSFAHQVDGGWDEAGRAVAPFRDW
jgi:hypothetical protein